MRNLDNLSTEEVMILIATLRIYEDSSLEEARDLAERSREYPYQKNTNYSISLLMRAKSARDRADTIKALLHRLQKE